MDAFPVAATAISRSVRGVEVHHFQDASSRRIPFQKKIGVGLDDAQFQAQVQAGTLRHVGLGESLHFIAARLGLRRALGRGHRAGLRRPRPRERARPRPRGPDLRRAPGSARLRREPARGEPEVPGLDRLHPDPHDRVIVDGVPAIDLVWRGGVQGDIATSAITLNSIASLRAAAPGLHTMAASRSCPARRRRADRMAGFAVDSAGAASAHVGGRDVVVFAGCDYLGLAHDPAVVDALARGLDRYGVSASASRATTSSSVAHDELEHDLARFLGLEAALLVPDGYLSNLVLARGSPRSAAPRWSTTRRT